MMNGQFSITVEKLFVAEKRISSPVSRHLGCCCCCQKGPHGIQDDSNKQNCICIIVNRPPLVVASSSSIGYSGWGQNKQASEQKVIRILLPFRRAIPPFSLSKTEKCFFFGHLDTGSRVIANLGRVVLCALEWGLWLS